MVDEEMAFRHFMRALAKLSELQITGATAALLEQLAVRPNMLCHMARVIDDAQLAIICRVLDAELALRIAGG